MKVVKVIVLILIGFISSSAKAQDTSGLFAINGTQLFITTMGEGEPILIVHGGPGLTHEYLLPHLAELSKNNRLIFYDQRSSGKSQLSVKGNMNFNMFAEDIESIRKFFNIEKLNILCHSWGALPVSTYLVNYPNNVKSIVYVNPVPMSKALAVESSKIVQEKISAVDSLKRLELLRSPEFQQGELKVITDLMLLSFKQLFCDTNKLALLDPKLPADYLIASLSLYGFAEDMGKFNFLTQIKDNPTPVLIIKGSCDISPANAEEQFKASFDNATLTVFEASGHFSFIEENKLFLKVVNKFYKGND